MELTHKELLTALHGMIFGSAYLLAFTGAFVALWGLRDEWITTEGAGRSQRRLIAGSWIMAILVWLTVLVGTYIVYPWYRAKPPKDVTPAELANYPRSLLLSKPQTADWHEFGMEWKEHIAWFAPILATAAAFVITKYRQQLAHDPLVRRVLLMFFTISFLCASFAGLFGALINKAAPTR